MSDKITQYMNVWDGQLVQSGMFLNDSPMAITADGETLKVIIALPSNWEIVNGVIHRKVGQTIHVEAEPCS